MSDGTDDKLDEILHRMHAVEERLGGLERHTDLQVLEQRTGFAEVKGSLAELRLTTAERHDALRTRLDTLVVSVADFRREYAEHVHPEPGAE